MEGNELKNKIKLILIPLGSLKVISMMSRNSHKNCQTFPKLSLNLCSLSVTLYLFIVPVTGISHLLTFSQNGLKKFKHIIIRCTF